MADDFRDVQDLVAPQAMAVPVPQALRTAAEAFCQQLDIRKKDFPIEFYQTRIVARHQKSSPTVQYLTPPDTEIERLKPELQAAAWAKHPKGLHRLMIAYLTQSGLEAKFPKSSVPWGGEENVLGNIKPALLGIAQLNRPSPHYELYAPVLANAAANLKEAADLLENYANTHSETELCALERQVIEQDPYPEKKGLRDTVLRLRDAAHWVESEQGFAPRWKVWTQMLEPSQISRPAHHKASDTGVTVSIPENVLSSSAGMTTQSHPQR